MRNSKHGREERSTKAHYDVPQPNLGYYVTRTSMTQAYTGHLSQGRNPRAYDEKNGVLVREENQVARLSDRDDGEDLRPSGYNAVQSGKSLHRVMSQNMETFEKSIYSDTSANE